MNRKAINEMVRAEIERILEQRAWERIQSATEVAKMLREGYPKTSKPPCSRK